MPTTWMTAAFHAKPDASRRPPGCLASQQKIRRLHAACVKYPEFEIRHTVTVDVATANTTREAQLPSCAGEAVCADEGEGLITGDGCLCINRPQVDFVTLAPQEIGDDVAVGAEPALGGAVEIEPVMART